MPLYHKEDSGQKKATYFPAVFSTKYNWHIQSQNHRIKWQLSTQGNLLIQKESVRPMIKELVNEKKANAAFCLWEIQPCKYKDMQTAKLVSSNVHFKKNLQKKQVFQMFLI